MVVLLLVDTVPDMIRTRLTATAMALTVAAAAAGCGGDAEPAAAPSPTPSSASPSPAPTSASPTPAASPSVNPDVPLKFGMSFTTADRYATATVYGFKQPVAKTAPRPDEQPGYVWAAADVKVCAGKADVNPRGLLISNGPWTLVYADDTQIEPSSTGYNQFPEPEFPFGEKDLAPGRCVRGWITFPAPGNKRPVAVEYAPDDEPVPPRWAVK